MLQLMNLQLTLFLLVAVGYMLKKINLVNEQGQSCLNTLVIYVVLPCNIVKSFMVRPEGAMTRDMTGIFLMSILVQVIFVIYGKLLFRRQPAGKKACLQYGTICSNAGILGNPVAEGVFGSYGLVLASVFLIPMRIMMWSEGLASFSGTTDRRATLKKVCTHPCIIACVLGVILMVTGFRFPAPITSVITSLGSCNTALSMMVIGMVLSNMTFMDFIDRDVLWYTLHRLVLLPILILLVCLVLPVSREVLGVCVLLSAMPAGATTSILAARYNLEPEFGAKMVIVSTVLSLPTICIWSMLLTAWL
ncbi:MAG: AEC family transporter [Lachnospiraceae bacterium]|nr:AEC family transporter [Lachnospiraceae bacterium]